MVEVVIFDIDGTLVDSVDLHARAWQGAFQHFGFDLPYGEIRHQIGKGGDQLLPTLLPKDVVERCGKAIEHYQLELFRQEFFPLVRPFPKVRELFERVRADGKRIALASSAKQEDLKTYRRIANIDGLVDVETSSDDAEQSKPHPDILESTMRRLGLSDPTVAVMIGDTPYDAEAASKIGLRALGVLCGGFPEADLRAAGCLAIYRDPADLLAKYDESLLARP
jgi:HAD superfamily hydrolase (TIGR01549 family)